MESELTTALLAMHKSCLFLGFACPNLSIPQSCVLMIYCSLCRLERVLKVQDLNVILRHFGISGRWQDLIQVSCFEHGFMKTIVY